MRCSLWRPRLLVGLAAAVTVLAGPAMVLAHNLGHIHFADGQCLAIGSAKDAPTVGPDGTQLDLVPQTPNPPFDEYGVSFVGFHGRTPVYPGPCDTHNHEPVNDTSQTAAAAPKK